MPEDIIPDDVRQFLSEHISSIEQLEILLLLSGSPQRLWSAAEVYQAILTNERSVERTLEKLHQSGLVQRSEAASLTYQFKPATERVTEVVSKLRELYRISLVRIVQAIYGPPVSKIDEFAKAFRIRKEK